MEMPIKVHVLAKEMGVGATYMTELLKACGLAGQKRVMKSRVLKFLRDNPNWKMPPPDERDTVKGLLREAYGVLQHTHHHDLVKRIERKIV